MPNPELAEGGGGGTAGRVFLVGYLVFFDYLVFRGCVDRDYQAGACAVELPIAGFAAPGAWLKSLGELGRPRQGVPGGVCRDSSRYPARMGFAGDPGGQ